VHRMDTDLGNYQSLGAAGADINIQDQDGNTALTLRAKDGSPMHVKALPQVGA
jgi:ankyrin repeat protein